MCGIIGFISNKSCTTKLIDGLLKLRYRGYDSCGLSVLAQKKLYTFKSLTEPQSLLPLIPNHVNHTVTAGIAHTRWATHGVVSLSNAHPQVTHGKISVVCNGIIKNHKKLRDSLIQKGYTFESETDTEVIGHYLDLLLKKHDKLEAFSELQKTLTGRYALACILEEDPECIYALCEDMPLFLAKTAQGIAIGSDLYAFPAHDEFCQFDSRTVYQINANGCSNKTLHYQKSDISDTPSTLNHPTHTLSEIYEQPGLIQDIPALWRDRCPIPPFIYGAKHILVIACGSSYHSALLLKYWLRDSAIHCDVDIASEFKMNPPHHTKQSAAILISQSGETADVLIALKQLKTNNTLALCNVMHSSLPMRTTAKIALHAKKEVGVASTKAFTAQAIALRLLYDQLHQRPILNPDVTSECTQQILMRSKEIRKIAYKYRSIKNILCLGKGEMLPIALEGALKIKELSYIHAEALPAGELKHGPLALVDPEVLVITLTPAPCNYMDICIHEVKSRHGKTLNIGAVCEHADDNIIISTGSSPLSFLPLNTALQLLAYFFAEAKGLNIDQPRNLAKSVTVE
ncbi:glutamine--fructose-6-phosphate transaminase (isomerizing) [Candidatus Comchoanobacter bicostacola]|uniref:Glutamine--fructose-6-phosphate aminotransferase [isomerizing] n=1 Tax=Candidatus Comchoanobacter bicostacola TaxID=2919598 RepID=A0ABY5DIX5_9GAMM|nr:glutamine--fructose-6-phosphate transaminase (isomerizing) [Candidatus Comchoanobacter bicostacola]UTC24541.1 glutamine--fructose-6-phosphate transaminase (isomerizing) [Candidatus Comchoanobacter bicostacola]